MHYSWDKAFLEANRRCGSLIYIGLFTRLPPCAIGRSRTRPAWCGILLLDVLDAPNLSIDQPYLDPMGVRSRAGQNVLDDASGQFSGSLVLLEDD